jgi:molecular chaperone DnaK
LEMTLTRSQFEAMCANLFDRCRIPLEQALKDAKIDLAKLDEVILVGGSTRIPAVQQLVRKLTGKDPCQSVNPDEVVAVGAAIQAGVLGGEVTSLLLLDVTPLSLGVETLGGVMTRLIERNTTIPVKKSEIFTTPADGQTSVEVHVLQGEREMAKDNKSLGMFRFGGIAPAPRGVPQIEVTFDIDANGILSASAQDRATGKQQSITITGASTLGKQDVERMVQEAERNATADRKRHEQIDAKNMADSLIYQTEKQLKELGDKVPTTDKNRVEGLIKELREAMNQENGDRIKSLSNDLQQAMMQVGSAVYAHAGNTASSSGEDVIDADVIE